jgi:hypothetical protein
LRFVHGDAAIPYELKPGDRVRVVTEAFLPFIEPGDKGTVQSRAPRDQGEGQRYYVQMDKAPGGRIVVFTQDEIEPDV